MSTESKRIAALMADFAKAGNFHAVVAGGLNLDKTLILDREPDDDGTARILKREHGFGGHAGNAACALARIGGQVSVLGSIGDDAAGQQVIENLQASGVKAESVFIHAGAKTGEVIIPVGPQRHFMMMDRGANDLESPPSRAKQLLAEGCDLLMVFDPPPPTARVLTELRKEAAWPLIWNPGGILVHDPSLTPLILGADILILNRSEFAAMFPADANGSLLPSECHTVIRTEGRNGCSVFCNGKATHVPSFSVSGVDETGAGDVFTAAFSFAFLMKQPVVQAARFACAAAALSTCAIGARGNLPGLDEVLSFIDACENAERASAAVQN